MYTISKEFGFSASHVLAGLPDGHPCGRVHGHNYKVRVTLKSTELDARGFLLDYNLLKPFGVWLDTVVDHRHLNDVVPMQPSAENLAHYFSGIAFETLPLPPSVRVSVAVSETEKTWAEYSHE